MLVALDFGRVYLGYVNLQNLARIAANFAANDPDAAFGPGSQYERIVLNDATATNCTLPQSGGKSTVAPPTFSDQNGDGDLDGLGDLASVTLTCSFGIITPVISDILGSSINVSASAAFPIKTGMASSGGGGGGGGGGGPVVPTAAFSADDTTVKVGDPVQFFDESGGSPTAWVWDFGDGTTSNLQDPVHVYSTTGSYTVTLTAGNAAGFSAPLTKVAYIGVSSPGDVAFTGTPLTGNAPLSVQFTDDSTNNPITWSWTFGDGGTSTLQDPVHVYTVAGTYTVTLTVTTANGSEPPLTKTNYISVAAALCTVPDFINTSTTGAQTLWNSRGFTTTVQFKQGGLPWTILSQTLTGNSQVPCTSPIRVSRTNQP